MFNFSRVICLKRKSAWINELWGEMMNTALFFYQFHIFPNPRGPFLESPNNNITGPVFFTFSVVLFSAVYVCFMFMVRFRVLN